MAEKYDNATFGANLKEIRQYQVRITQEELSKRSGVDQNSIARYENDVNTPGLDKAVALASALGVTLNELYPMTTA